VKRLYVVCEGFCEEAFVRTKLRPHLRDRDVWAEAIIVKTSRDHHGHKHRGGGRWKRWANDLERVYREQAGPSAWVTTMFDLYGLPKDFPRRDEIRQLANPAQKVALAEQALEQAVRELSEGRWFIPYVQRHELEALVLACLDDLRRMLDSRADLEGLTTLSAELGETPPEDVNDGKETAPSKRLIRHLPGYDKLLYSEYALCEVALSTLAERCPHFGQWLARLEAIAAAPA
jgi:hypothetical protein